MLSILACFIITITTNHLFDKFPSNIDTPCISFVCIIKAEADNYLLYLTLIELISAIVLLVVIMLKKRPVIKGKSLNHAVIMLVTTSLVFEFGPNVLDLVFKLVSFFTKLKSQLCFFV